MAEDWRLEIDLPQDAQRRILETLGSSPFERDVRRRLGGRVVVSSDEGRLFLYTDTEEAAREAEHAVAAAAAGRGVETRASLTRWHPGAEEWEPADRPLPLTESERAAEHAERIAKEREETTEDDYAEWEVRVTLPSLHAAGELSARLENEGVPHVRRWRWVLVGATDEDAAKAWRERLQSEAPAGSDVAVEATFAAVDRQNPFAVLSALGGNP